MKKFNKLALAIVLLAMLFIPTTVSAAGGSVKIELSASAGSAVANGSSTITFTVFTYKYYCESNSYDASDFSKCGDGSAAQKLGDSSNEMVVEASGSGNILSANQVKTGSDGKATFTLASTVAGSKTVKTYSKVRGPSSGDPTQTVTFNAPVAPQQTIPTPTPAPTPEVKAPEAPKTAGLEINGETVSITEKVTLPETESLVLKGTTVPNGVVKLFIFSTPKEATVTADAQGNWTYEVSGLEVGDHHVEAEVTDPTTNKTSERANLAAFTVEAAQTVAETPAPAPKSKIWLWLVAGGVIVLSTAAAVTWWWFKKRKKSNDLSTPPAATTSSSSNQASLPPSQGADNSFTNPKNQ